MFYFLITHSRNSLPPTPLRSCTPSSCTHCVCTAQPPRPSNNSGKPRQVQTVDPNSIRSKALFVQLVPFWHNYNPPLGVRQPACCIFRVPTHDAIDLHSAGVIVYARMHNTFAVHCQCTLLEMELRFVFFIRCFCCVICSNSLTCFKWEPHSRNCEVCVTYAN